VPQGDGTQGLQPLGIAGQIAALTLASVHGNRDSAPTSVTLFDQGLLQVLQASATGLQPRQPYVLALAERPDGSGTLQPLANFTTNPAGSAIVNAIGPIRQLVQASTDATRRYLGIAPVVDGKPGQPVQTQVVGK
jgi:hypothetical protein